MLKTRYKLLFICAMVSFGILVYAKIQEDRNKELQVKAAFVYNFLKFVDWPREALPEDKNIPVTVGLAGDDFFVDYLSVVKDKQAKGHPIQLIQIESYAQMKDKNANLTYDMYFQQKQKEILACHVIIVGVSEEPYFSILLKSIARNRILTISEIEGFSRQGGIIEFILENKKVRFDINSKSAEDNNLKLNSQLMQLARTIYKE